jgi:hypothetical protein
MVAPEWINEYVRLAFPISSKDLRIQDAQKLKYEHIPPSLYRFRTCTDYNINNLKKGVEWFSYPKDFNDPYDAGMRLSFHLLKNDIFVKRMLPLFISYSGYMGISFNDKERQTIENSQNPIEEFMMLAAVKDNRIENVVGYFSKDIDKIVQGILDDAEKKLKDSFKDGYLVSCFSEELGNGLMWSHYAEYHSGYCIEYDFKGLGLKHVRNSMLYPVIYSQSYFDATEYYRSTLLGDIKEYNNLFGVYPTISKSPEWSYEKEWRMIFPYGPSAPDEIRALSMPKPKAIYLGVRMNEENRDTILQIAKERKVPVYQVVQSQEGFTYSNTSLYKP